MEKKRLFFDMDNVLVDFQSGIDQLDEATRQEYAGRLDEVPGIFSLMKPVEGAPEAVRKLAEFYDVFILSTAPWNNPSAWSDKVEWVKKHFGEVFYKRMVITHRKDLCEGDYLIDDRGKNGTSDFKGEWIKFGSPYFPNWNAVTEYLLIRKNREKSKTLLDNRNSYSWAALFILLFFEFFTIAGVRQQNPTMYWGALFIMILFCFLLIGVGWGNIKYLFWPNKKIFTKLMANAIAPTRLGAIYLLLFVIHLGWLSDGSLNYFQSNNDNLLPVSISVITSIIGIFELICFFPEGKQNKENASKVVLVSGISKLSSKETIIDNTSLFLYSLYNVNPLASIFNLCFKSHTIKKENVSKLIILSSDIHYQLDFFKNGVVEVPITKIAANEWEELLEAHSVQLFKSTSQTAFLKIPLETDNSNHFAYVEDCLRAIIKVTAICQFPEMKDFFKRLVIEFTNPCDYDNFEQCFEVLSDAVKKEDEDKDTRLFFNLTPGTGIVGSLMTLFSLDKYRNLYFYAQNSSKEILPVNKSRVPLENLLSQALDTE